MTPTCARRATSSRPTESGSTGTTASMSARSCTGAQKNVGADTRLGAAHVPCAPGLPARVRAVNGGCGRRNRSTDALDRYDPADDRAGRPSSTAQRPARSSRSTTPGTTAPTAPIRATGATPRTRLRRVPGRTRRRTASRPTFRCARPSRIGPGARRPACELGPVRTPLSASGTCRRNGRPVASAGVRSPGWPVRRACVDRAAQHPHPAYRVERLARRAARFAPALPGRARADRDPVGGAAAATTIGRRTDGRTVARPGTRSERAATAHHAIPGTVLGHGGSVQPRNGPSPPPWAALPTRRTTRPRRRGRRPIPPPGRLRGRRPRDDSRGRGPREDAGEGSGRRESREAVMSRLRAMGMGESDRQGP